MILEKIKLKVGRQNVLLALLLVCAFFAYVFFSRHFTFWGDELYSIYYAKQNTEFFISNYFASPDNHPPLYYLLLNIWQKIFNIGFVNDYLYKILSILFHFLTIGFITRFYLKDNIKRGYFIVLSLVSSFFLIFSQMVRYYTIAAFFYIVTLFFFNRWLDLKNKKSLIIWLICFVVLAYTDYPSALFLAVTGVVLLLLKGRNYIKTINWYQVFIALDMSFLLLLPLLYLNAIYYYSFGSLGASELGGNLSIFIKAVAGMLFVFYHFLIGEYFNILISPILVIFLLYILFSVYQIYQLVDKLICKKYIFIIFTNIIFGSLFLAFFVGRYPIFSFARFLLPVAYLLLLLFVELFYIRKKYLLFAIIVVNIFVIYNNLNDKNFINPTYFFPQRVSYALAANSNLPIIVGHFGQRGFSSADYFLQKNFLNRVIYDHRATRGAYLLFYESRLCSSATATIKEVASQYDSIILNYGGYDNINVNNKWLMSHFGLMESDYKYYYFVLQKK